MDHKNGHKQDISLKEIGLRAQNLLIILRSTVSRIGGICMINSQERES